MENLISSTDVALMSIDEVTGVMQNVATDMNDENEFTLEGPGNVQKDFTPEDLCTLKAVFIELEKAIDEIPLKNREEATSLTSFYFPRVLSGQRWYQLEVSRAGNQEIGRMTRHRNDYGAIILCDCCFNTANFKKLLSAWLRPYLKSFANFGIVRI